MTNCEVSFLIGEPYGVFKMEVRFFHCKPVGEFKAKFRFGEFRIEFILRGLEAFYAVYGLYLDYFFLIGLSKLDLLEPILTLF